MYSSLFISRLARRKTTKLYQNLTFSSQHVFHSSLVSYSYSQYPYPSVSNSGISCLNYFHMNQLAAFSSTPKSLQDTTIDNIKVNKMTTGAQDNVDKFFNDDFLHANYSPNEVAKVIAKAGLTKSNISLVDHYSKIAAYLETTSEVVTSQNLCYMIYGLGGNIYGHSDELYRIINLMANKLFVATEECSEDDISKALLGLKHLTDEKVEVQILISAITVKLKLCSQAFSSHSISGSFYALQNMNGKSEVTRQLLICLIPKVESCVESFTAKRISMVMFGLKNMHDDTDELNQLLQVLIPKIELCSQPLTARGMEMVFSGLRLWSADNKQVRALLKVLLPKIAGCTELMKVEVALRCLARFRKLNMNHLEVQLLLKALLPQIESSTGRLNSHIISDTLYYLSCMDTDIAEVRQLIATLIPKIESYDGLFNSHSALKLLSNLNKNHEEVSQLFEALEFRALSYDMVFKTQRLHHREAPNHSVYNQQPFIDNALNRDITHYNKFDVVNIIRNAGKRGNKISIAHHYSKLLVYLETTTDTFKSKQVCNMIYGLAGFTLKSEEVYKLLAILLNKLSDTNTNDDNATMADLTMVLSGLQGFGSNRPEVKNLIKVLTIKVQSCSEIFCSQAIANALYGLNRINSDSVEVRQLISALIPKIESFTEQMTSQEIGISLYGLKSMTSVCEEVRQLLLAITPKIKAGADTLDIFAVTQSLKFIENMDITNSIELRSLVEVLIPKIESCNEPMSASQVIISIDCLKDIRYVVQMRQLAKVLIPKIESSSDPFYLNRMDWTLKRLKTNNNECDELHQLLMIIEQKTVADDVTHINAPQINENNTQYNVDNYLNQNVTGYSKFELIHVLRKAHSANMNVSRYYSKILSYLIETTEDALTKANLCDMIFSLLMVQRDAHAETQSYTIFYEIISTLTNKFSETKINDFCSVNDIAMLLYGLRYFTSYKSEIKNLLKVISAEIQSCPDEFDSRAIANSFFGLNRMSNDCDEVRQILVALTCKFELCTGTMNAFQIASVLYGLKYMNSDGEEVCHLLRVLTSKIESCTEMFDSLAIGRSLKGLQRMNIINSDEVRNLVKALIPKLESCPEILSTESIFYSLFALKNMRDSLEMRQLASLLILKIDSCSELKLPVDDDSTSTNTSTTVKRILFRLKTSSNNNECDELDKLLKILKRKTGIKNNNNNNNNFKSSSSSSSSSISNPVKKIYRPQSSTL